MSATVDDSSVVPHMTLKQRPVAHRLLQGILLPLSPITDLIGYWMDQLGFDLKKCAREREQLLEAILHHYFTDAEGRRWQRVVEVIGEWKFNSCSDDMRLELLNTLHRLLQNTTGPLMPSYVYQYYVQRDTLVLTPTLPTIENYESRIHDLADPDEGWIPTRQRR